MLEKILREIVASVEGYVLARLKYNIFSSDHPKKSFRGRLFKFIGENQIQFLNTNKKTQVSNEDLSLNGKKLYYPADMA